MLPTREKISNEYFTEEGIVKRSGYNSWQFNKGIIKELIDNAIDFIETQDDCFIVNISITDEGLFIGDDAPGFDMDMIDSVLMNYEDFISTNRSYHKVSRGSQGNALKSILGICYIKDYTLMICNEGKCFAYIPSDDNGNIRIIKTEVTDKEYYGKGVYIKGLDSFYQIDIDTLKRIIFQYSLSNKHITFLLNGQVVFERSGELNTKYEHSIHYYSSEAFLELVKGVISYNQAITTKDFIKQFDNTRSLMKGLPGDVKYLKDLSDNDLLDIYYYLYQNSKQATKRTLMNKYSLNADDLQATINNHYQREFELSKSGSFFKFNNTNGFVYIQGFLFYNPEKIIGNVKTLASINRSISIEEGNPLSISLNDDYLNILKSGANHMEGDFLLVLNLISPNFHYSSYDKSSVDLDYYNNDIRDMLSNLLKPVTKEMKSIIHQKAKQNRESKTALMKKYFDEAYRIAKGSYSTVMARQVFYKLREIINKKHNREISSMYDTFTQKIITEFQEKDDKYDNIYMEERGFFYSDFFKKRNPLSTDSVRSHTGIKHNNTISKNVSINYNLSPKYLINKALFIEKRGFFNAIKESGLLEELNMDLICSVGMGNRAAKELIKYYNDLGIKVYCLHDCDVSGIRIYHCLANPTKTYKGKLDVIDIGFNPSDVKEYGWIPEEHETTKYKDVINNMDTNDRKFFYVKERIGKTKKGKAATIYTFRRVELDSPTNDELIDFIRSKIKPTPLIPDDQIILNSIEYDEKDIIKDMLYKSYLENKADDPGKFNQLESDLEININDLIESIKEKAGNGKHWTELIRSEYNQKKQEQINRLCKNVKLELS